VGSFTVRTPRPVGDSDPRKYRPAGQQATTTTRTPLERSRHEIEVDREPFRRTSTPGAGAEVEVDPGACGRYGRQRGVAGNVLATPSSGVSTTILAESQFSSFFAQGHAFPPAYGALMAAYGKTDVYVVDNKIDPRGTTGWHSHLGPSLILVMSGEVTNYTTEAATASATLTPPGKDSSTLAARRAHAAQQRHRRGRDDRSAANPPRATRKIDAPTNPTHCPV
jgi:hypothetical protein